MERISAEMQSTIDYLYQEVQELKQETIKLREDTINLRKQTVEFNLQIVELQRKLNSEFKSVLDLIKKQQSC